MMNWYTFKKKSSSRDDKKKQLKLLLDNIEEVIDQTMIGGNETIKIIDQLISRLNGESGFRNLIPPSTKNNVLKLLIKAREVKKDSPQKCMAFLEEALSYLF